MEETGRRAFLGSLLAGAGLALSYGLLGAYALAYLFPPAARRRAGRLFIGRVGDFAAGRERTVVDQKGRSVLVLAGPAGLDALDTRCPHLGCKVHWEPDQDRFVCPCHQGIFDRTGVAIAGPPAAAGQALARVPLEIDPASGTVFLESAG